MRPVLSHTHSETSGGIEMEKDYLITIRGTVEQTFHIKADNLDKAEQQAREQFDIGNVKEAEKYTEEVTSAAWTDWVGK